MKRRSIAVATFLVTLLFTAGTLAASERSKGVALFEAGRTEEAGKWLSARVASHPDESSAQHYYGRILLEAGSPKEARGYLKRAAKLDPNNSEYHFWVGRAYIDELQNANFMKQSFLAPRVKSAFEKAVELDPDNVEARIYLGNYYLNAPAIGGGSRKKAKEQANEIIKRDSARGHFFMAEVLAVEGNDEEAEKHYRKVVQDDPGNVEAHYSLGRFYQDRERFAEAFASFENVVEADPGQKWAWYQIGRTGALSGKNLDRSIEALEVFVDQFFDEKGVSDDFRAGAWWRLGMLWEHKKELHKARESYQTAMKVVPGYDNARKALESLN